MIKIFGSPMSSAGRCYWMLEEAGLKYERVPLSMSEKQHKSAEYLKLNPNGKVPTLIDGDFILWESMAINQYLALKYKPEFLGQTHEENGLIQQWSFWAMSELQPPMVDVLIQTKFVPEGQRNLELIERSRERAIHFLRILDSQLENKNFLLADRFTLADLNVASAASIGLALGFDYTQFKAITTWFEKCLSRPARQRVPKE